MQLVLAPDGKPLPKGQRAVRVYLQRRSAAGFKGRPVLFEDGRAEERDLTVFHLSRYAYMETALRGPLGIFCTEDKKNGTVYFRIKGMPKKSREGYLKYLVSIVESIEKEGIARKEDRYLKDAIQAFGYLDDDIIGRIREFCQITIDKFITILPRISLAHSRKERFGQVLKEIREIGVSKITLFTLSHLVVGMLEEKKKDLNLADRLPSWFYKFAHYYTRILETPVWGERPKNGLSGAYPKEKDVVRDIIALNILFGIFYAEATAQYTKSVNSKKEEMSGDLARIKFTQGETNAWRYIQNNFTKLDEAIILRAMRFERFRKRYGREDRTRIRELLELHKKYAIRQAFEVNGHRLRLEASPFAERPIGNPTGRFAIVVYPEEPRFIRSLKRIADPTFEHSDGALAVARITINNGRIILEEIQSDIETMLKAGAGVKMKDGVVDLEETERSIERMLKRHLNGDSEKLKPLVEEWQKIVMQALRIFAKTHGFKEFYAATPHRVLSRYWGAMHPDKAKLYFDGWEKMGGTLVFDDKRELDKLPQYYYRFELSTKTELEHL